MKKLFVPRGESVSYEDIYTEDLVVNGYLKVDGAIHARHISGDGAIEASTITAETLVMGLVEAEVVTAGKIVVHSMTAPECRGEVILVSGYLSANRVKAVKLTVGLSDILKPEADEVINLSSKKHSLLGALILSWLRCKWMELCRRPEKKEYRVPDQDADGAAAGNSAPIGGSGNMDMELNPFAGSRNMDLSPSSDVASNWDPEDADDFEFLRLKSLYSLLKDQGYVLRLIPIDDPAKPGAATEKAA